MIVAFVPPPEAGFAFVDAAFAEDETLRPAAEGSADEGPFFKSVGGRRGGVHGDGLMVDGGHRRGRASGSVGGGEEGKEKHPAEN